MGDSSLVAAASSILQESDAFNKKALTDRIVSDWSHGLLAACSPDADDPSAPDQPSRDGRVKIVAPKDIPKLVDLSWDIIARFGSDPAYKDHLPKQFFDDFVEVAQDECRHFTLLAKRLEELGSSYGAFPAHEGLWQSARDTSASLPARLAVEHCVHEARGLDVLPSTIKKFRNAGDHATADLLEQIVLPEEVAHCAAGVRWLKHLYAVATASAAGATAVGRGSAPVPRAASVTAATEVKGTRAGGSAVRDGSGLPLAGGGDGLCEGLERLCAGHRPVEDAAYGNCAAFNNGSPAAVVGSGGAGTEQPTTQRPATKSHGAGCTADGEGGSGHADPAWMVEARQYDTVEQWFHALVRAHFKGNTKPPFNKPAREQAGFTEAWYKPLAM